MLKKDDADRTADADCQCGRALESEWMAVIRDQCKRDGKNQTHHDNIDPVILFFPLHLRRQHLRYRRWALTFLSSHETPVSVFILRRLTL
jgi:hypothetical protein